MRVNTQRRQPENLYRKTQRNLLRELAVWHALQRNPHKNILQLFGVASLPISDYLASVSEFCRFSLVAYFNDPPEKPEYLRFMKEILEGLAHMHNLSPPIIHGDLKFPNILLSFAGVVKICDFGQSRFNNDQRGLASEASFTFQATHRYMSPELFDTRRKVKPTALSDVLAYGCVALQLLSRLKPYHTIKDDFTVSKAITGGLVPSLKPEKPYAPPCLNEHLWDVVRSCWSQLDFRPTATRLLNELNRLMEQKLVDTSPITPDRNSIDFDGTLPDWPVKIEDFGPLRGGAREEVINSSRRAEVRIRYAESEPLQVFNLSIFNISLGQGIGTNTEGQRTSAYIIKAPNPPRRKSSRATKLDPFLYLLRRMVRERYSLQHQNIVEMIGFDSSFGLYPGLVFEYCENSSLEKYAARVAGNEYTHIRYMIHILEGLRHLHTFPTPIAHGDLNPSNILVDANGTLKLTLFSLSRLAADMPRAEESSSLIDFVESIRYFSPESLHVEARPSVWADMWAFGCIVFWIHTKLPPYHEARM
ncbi:kinase-like protein [Ceratobasidium sp. AG-I]|nr:kinase-like protein [Ceratobasidium sp. AG-I]